MEEYEIKPFSLLYQKTTMFLMKQWLIRLQKVRDKALAAHELAQQKSLNGLLKNLSFLRRENRSGLRKEISRSFMPAKKLH